MQRAMPPSPLRNHRALATALFLITSATAAQNARADTPSCNAGDRECGRRAFSQGTTLFDQKDYAQARAWFLAAQAAGAHPVIAFNLALCSARLGKLSSARNELTALISDPTSDAALRARAQQELAAAEAALAHVHVESADPSQNRIELDGELVDAPAGELSVDPGAHHFRVSSRDVVVFDQDVRLEPGEQLRLRVTNRARAIDVVVVPESRRAAPAAPVPAPQQPSGLSPVWFYATASATVLLSAGSIWSGLDVRNAYDHYQGDLPRLTQAEADARVEDGHSRELRTNLLLGATVLSAAGTALVGLVLVDWKSKPEVASRASLTLGASRAELALTF
jgi:hypothetical protein